MLPALATESSQVTRIADAQSNPVVYPTCHGSASTDRMTSPHQVSNSVSRNG